MIAVQSYYSFSKLKDWEKKCWELSYHSILEYTNAADIVIYVNDASLIPFDASNIVLLPNTYEPEFKKGWWQVYKQYLYSYINEPFIHIDIDLILKKDLGQLNGDIICEKIRPNNLFTGIEKSMGYNRQIQLLCSGIMGKTSNHQMFSESFEAGYNFMKNYNNFVRDSYRWTLEESVIGDICKRNSATIQAFDDSYYYHFQGRLQKMMVDNQILIENMYQEKFQ